MGDTDIWNSRRHGGRSMSTTFSSSSHSVRRNDGTVISEHSQEYHDSNGREKKLHRRRIGDKKVTTIYDNKNRLRLRGDSESESDIRHRQMERQDTGSDREEEEGSFSVLSKSGSDDFEEETLEGFDTLEQFENEWK